MPFEALCEVGQPTKVKYFFAPVGASYGVAILFEEVDMKIKKRL
jgi:hypothetical protein